ncbi:hypothetical protein SmJEL517_g00694 [Synchytrium microbalum]|uniref:AN1-type domain-containing protein n=1 Tax=Synchytrium microbalum TaxID=1806994 RepID=A0A507C7S9_9FUNG|nr:uncharacterized protein SmJEL517_g00694 [Synchytrium microbalum]TPX37630.1 hypothetical protein SmJEL517_g00694 [Synchytrium microbalum]
MELSHVGKHCLLPNCNQLDFLPFNCAYCANTYCQDHWRVSGHSCEKAPTDYYAPVCPVCSKVVPVPRNEDPNLKVDEHIRNGCPTPKTTTTEAYTNKCSMPGCKTKEVVPILCKKCLKSHCLKHRFETDHNCTPVGTGNSRNTAAARAALARTQISKASQPAKQPVKAPHPPQPPLPAIKAQQPRMNDAVLAAHLSSGLTEDEQIALAVQQSLEQPTSPRPTNWVVS